MGVVGVDSVVVEGWSSCFVVSLVLVVGQGLYFGELVLAPFGLSGDFYGVVGQFCFLDTATTGPDPRKVDTSGVSYAAWVSVADVSASKSLGARKLHQECRLRVL